MTRCEGHGEPCCAGIGLDAAFRAWIGGEPDASPGIVRQPAADGVAAVPGLDVFLWYYRAQFL